MPEMILTPRRIAGFNSHNMTMNLGSVAVCDQLTSHVTEHITDHFFDQITGHITEISLITYHLQYLRHNRSCN
jgi:hypothetical protein